MIQNTTGTVNEPNSAGRHLNPTYGTLLLIYESPILSKRKCPSYPINQPVNANRIFAIGGWTSKKYNLCKYCHVSYHRQKEKGDRYV